MLLLLPPLLLMLGGLSAVAVPPPADVTVSCHNFQTTVSWSYGEQAQTRFRVEVVQSDRRHERETAERRYDLSPLVWDSADSSMDYHYVTVTAVRGGNQSEPVASKSLSFNPLKTPYVKCLLEFPPVELAAGDSGATVSFPNPLHFYKELNRVARQAGVSFQYSVSTQNETFYATCAAEDAHCRRDVSLPEGEEPCVALGGRLCSRDCLGEVAFRDTECVFASTSDNVLGLTFGLMLGLLAFVVIVAVVAVFKVKGWTMRRDKEETPNSLKLDRKRRRLTNYAQSRDGNDEETSPVIVVVPDGSDKADGSEDDCPSSCSKSRSHSSEEGYQDGGLSEDSSQGSACGASGADDGSERTECVSMDAEDGDGGYDRPHHLLDMGNGDMVSCYTSR